MPWVAAIPAVVGMVGSLTNDFGRGTGGGGPRGVNLTSAQADPWNLAARQGSLDAQAQQGKFVDQLQAQNGIGNQNNVFGQQQQLAGQLQNQAMGQGPNPAQAMLANTTGQNAANQAALMGSQRGTSANAGLIARQAAMQGGGLQQQAAGQGAALMAQQQIAAQQALMQQQASMAGLATNQVNQAQTGVQNLTQVNQNQQQMQLQSLANWNNVNASAANGAQNANAQFAQLGQQQGAAQAQGAGAGLAAVGSMMKFNGGTIQNYAQGGVASNFGKYCNNMKSGGNVPGKANVPGNSLKNDTVPAMLSPGEVVIDRETLNSKGKEGQAARFLKAYLAKKNRSK